MHKRYGLSLRNELKIEFLTEGGALNKVMKYGAI